MSLENSLKADILQVVQDIPVTFGVAIKYLESGEEVLLNNDRTYQLASVFQSPVLVTSMQQVDAGRFGLGDRIELKDAHKTAPSGILLFLDDGLQPTFKDLLMLMIIISDNTATDMVLDLVGGPPAVNASLRELGFKASEINITASVHDMFEAVWGTSDPVLHRRDLSRFKEPNFEVAVFKEGSTVNVATPQAMNRLNEMILRGQAASREMCDVALDIMLHQTLNDRLPSQFGPDIDDVEVAHKTGTFFVARNDSGIIYVGDEVHVAVTVLTRKPGKPVMAEYMDPAYRKVEAAIDRAIGAIAKLAYDYAEK
jgi:beta-lactamase class A